MRAVTATINFQDGTVNIDKMTPAQKNAYLEAHMVSEASDVMWKQHINNKLCTINITGSATAHGTSSYAISTSSTSTTSAEKY